MVAPGWSKTIIDARIDGHGFDAVFEARDLVAMRRM
jgi:hypothetical protein